MRGLGYNNFKFGVVEGFFVFFFGNMEFFFMFIGKVEYIILNNKKRKKKCIKCV